MIHIVNAENIGRYSAFMAQAYRLRHDVFVDDMGWEELRKPNQQETDQFDNKHAMHMLYIEGDTVLGYQRLLPTLHPHLLSDVLSDLCDGPRPSGPHIWEWTRYCVARAHRERGRALSPIANALLSSIVEWGLESGVSEIIIEMDPIWLLRLVQLHFRVTPLGIPKRIGKADTVAVTAAFDARTLARLQEMRGNTARVIAARPAQVIRLSA